MKISVFGLGYVGCVSAACLAQNGHEVLGLDVNPQKAELVSSGRAPVIEGGLDSLMREAVQRGSLRVTSDSRAAIHNSDASMICAGTPSNRNGSLNLQYVENVCCEIGAGLADKRGYHVVVVRSTILPGSTEERFIPLLEGHSGRRAGPDFGVCMNPEFLREGSAVVDFYNPGLVIIGELDQRSGEVIEALYADIQASTTRTTIRTAEMIKYANNAFHALKVVFANEIGVVCKAHGIDGREVMETLCQDTRLNISPAYLRPGFAFGGSCLPKDLRALLYRAKQQDLECSLLKAILVSNQQQVQRGIELVESTGYRKIGVLGLSFKPGTDDMRESPVVSLVETLIGKGYSVSIYDERVELGRLVGTNKAFLEREILHIASLMCSSLEELLEWSEVVVVTHGGASFRRVLPLIREDQKLIDLVGTATSDERIRGAYEAICW
jgi:GDP-mannose 6-dehydrogenase